MKKKILCIIVFCTTFLLAQEKDKYYSFDVNNFYGTVLNHNPDISHLITGHPTGVILGFNRKTFGKKEWERLYNSPDYGVSFIYQDMDNQALGENYGLYAHYNFYFLNRSISLKIGQGLAYSSNPYDQDSNFRNIAYGSHLMSSTIAFLNYKKEYVVGGLGVETGLGVIHYSNANVKAPNKSTNTFVFNIGFNYSLKENNIPKYVIKEKGLVKGAEPIGYGFFYRGGVNENDIVGSGQYLLHTLGAFVDKRVNKKSALQLGTEVFFSEALQRFIAYRSTGDFGDGVTGEEDSRRVGLFLGHELRIDKIAILTQLGYYAYYPFDYEGRVYNRLGAGYYFNNRIFSSVTVRSHSAKAEAVEFSIGYRL